MASFKQYTAIKKVHNDGIRVDIPDYPGLPSGQWLLVRGKESDAYRAADLRKQRAMGKFFSDALKDVHESKLEAEIAKANTVWTETREAGSTLEMAAACIAGWSFDDDLTPDNVAELLGGWPALLDLVVAAVKSAEGFRIGVSSNSADTPNGSSDSSSQPETQETSGSTSKSSGEQLAPSQPS